MGTRFIRWSAGLATGVAVILAFALVLAPSTGLGGATNALAEGSPPRPTLPPIPTRIPIPTTPPIPTRPDPDLPPCCNRATKTPVASPTATPHDPGAIETPVPPNPEEPNQPNPPSENNPPAEGAGAPSTPVAPDVPPANLIVEPTPTVPAVQLVLRLPRSGGPPVDLYGAVALISGAFVSLGFAVRRRD